MNNYINIATDSRHQYGVLGASEVRGEAAVLYLLATFKHARKNFLVKIVYLHGLGLWSSNFVAKLIALSL